MASAGRTAAKASLHARHSRKASQGKAAQPPGGRRQTSSLQQNPSRAIMALAALGPQLPAA
jgi:hypothetical protein